MMASVTAPYSLDQAPRATGLFPVDRAARLGSLAPKVLRLFAAGDTAPVVLSGATAPEAWLLSYAEFDRLARYRAWAMTVDRPAAPDDEAAQAANQYAADAALDLDREVPLPSGVEHLPLDTFVERAAAVYDGVAHRGRAPVAFGSTDRPEAAIVSTNQYDELRTAERRWQRSPAFLSSLPAEQAAPHPDSREVDLDEFFAELGELAEELWREVKLEFEPDAERLTGADRLSTEETR
jgi:PHD/YefM family antitoxin component YafN of YafNO toxin-antitoxin module